MRLIDADTLFAEFENAKWYDNNDRDLVAEDILMDAPTIDAVNVVRCKDCERAERPPYGEHKGQTYCHHWRKYFVDNGDYCSFGKRI